jgi:hypothetical protein
MSDRPFGVGLVHGVVATDRQAPLPRIADAFDKAEVIDAAADPHALLISEVPLPLQGEIEAGTLFSDPARISALAMAHHRILAALAATTDVVPIRLGTLVSGLAGARDLMTREARRFADRLAAIHNSVEFGIRMLPARAPVPAIAKLNAAASGRDYLHARSQQRARGRPASVDMALGELARRAVATCARRPSPRAGQPPAIVDAAFLVDRGKLAAFTKCAGRIERQIAADGLALDVFGPLPAYSFVERDAEKPE